MDGIQAAEVIRDRWGIPVVFVTAYADPDRLERAKLTYPFGYILKPFQDRELQITIEMALYVARSDRKRKKAEDSLRQSENVLRRIIDILPVGLWITDKYGKLLSGNPEGIRIWGGEPKVGPEGYGAFKARRLPSGEVVGPDDWAMVHTIKEGVTVSNEMLEIETFDDRKRIILNYTAPVLDDDGLFQGAIAVNQDITELKRMEEALRVVAESGTAASDEGILRFLARHLAASQDVRYAMIARIDPGDRATAHTIAIWNSDGYDENTDYVIAGTPCEVVIRTGSAFFPRDVGKLFPDNKIFLDLDVESYWGASLRNSDGDVIGVLAILDDRPMEERPQTLSLLKTFAARAALEIERQQTVETLEESEERFRLTYYTSPDAVNLNRLSDGLYLDINEGFTRLTGFTREDVIGRTSEEIGIWHDPDDRQKLLEGLRENGYYENLEARFRFQRRPLRRRPDVGPSHSSERRPSHHLHHTGHHRTQKAGKPAPPSHKNGSRRHACRRNRSRFQ